MFTYSLAGHSVGLGYQKLSGDSDFPFMTMGDGVRAYLISDRSLNTFQRAGERSLIGTYAFDFAAVGVPGLRLAADYVKGDRIRSATGERKEWFRGTTLEYAVQNSIFKGLSLAVRNGSYRGDVERVRGVDETRVIVSYKLPLL
ncbi:Porin-like protein NicP precursor [compost metagenome]